jgi:hypothetical protein
MLSVGCAPCSPNPPNKIVCQFDHSLMAEGWDDLVYSHNVTLVLAGHAHGEQGPGRG